MVREQNDIYHCVDNFEVSFVPVVQRFTSIRKEVQIKVKDSKKLKMKCLIALGVLVIAFSGNSEAFFFGKKSASVESSGNAAGGGLGGLENIIAYVSNVRLFLC